MSAYLGNIPINQLWLGSTLVSDFQDIKQIVTSGSILYLDAGNPASYPGTGTIWTDLSGNNNSGSLINSPTFNSANNGSLVFNGTNQYANTANTVNLTTATFLMWIKSNGNQDQYDGMIFSRDTQATGMNFQSSNQIGYTWNSAEFGWASGLSVPNSEWCMVSVVVNPSNAIAYLYKQSGITTATNTTTHSTSTGNKFVIGQDTFGSRFINANVSLVMVYNRALSQAELTQNFNATKYRYGIT